MTKSLFWLSITIGLAGCGVSSDADAPPSTRHAGLGAEFPGKGSTDRMSPSGRLAARARATVRAQSGHIRPFSDNNDCVNQPDCSEGGYMDDAPTATHSEVALAVDHTGRHVVIGFNDFRGFLHDPISLSGFMYSDDGGRTFIDGGQLPSPGNEVIGTTKFPEVFGDPDVKYLGACNFVYSSILVRKFGAADVVQTMSIHRSTDCGHTWTGPFEVSAATNPNGLLMGGSPEDAADKEFLDVDPDTGRVLISWSNFSPASPGVEISTSYSDDVLTGAPPTWSPRKLVAATAMDGQGSVPRFAGNGSPNAYVTWGRFTNAGNNIGFARSTDNGTTWSAPINLAGDFFPMDQVLGNDRVHSFPSMAVDNSRGPHSGNIYVVHANNDLKDGADISFQRSTDQGLTFSAPLKLNSRPGADRPQWFPFITVDRNTGRLYVLYFDQGIAESGDLTEVSYTYSDDGGIHFSPPSPLSERPFSAGWGNDTGQPNLGDYIGGTAQGGQLFASFAETRRPPGGYADGEPDGTGFTVPFAGFKRTQAAHDEDDEDRFTTPVNLGAVTFSESGGNGNIDPGDLVQLHLPLRNYVTNPLNQGTLDGLHAHLSVKTPGVVVIFGASPYGDLAPGATGTNKRGFLLFVEHRFKPGTPIELVLEARATGHRTIRLPYTLFTGTPSATTVFHENFDGVAPGTLPAGWTSFHQGGANVVPWTSSNTFCGSKTNAAFHVNANDGVGPKGDPTRFERLFSPVITVPATSDYVTLDFDVCYDTEDDPNFKILAYDGLVLRITDMTTGRMLRSVLAEAFEDEFTTGTLRHYPKHFPRSGNTNYFQDMSAWAGDSGGFQHVHMRLPGMAGSKVQLRFEYTQDGAGICTDAGHAGPCGVAVDNIVMKNVVSVRP